MKGTHDIRFGFDFVHHLMNHWQPELGEGPRGAFYFDPGVTALNPDALDADGGFQGGTPSFENDWNALAGFLLGTPTCSGKSSQFIKMDSFENQYALYVRDRWRATPKLTRRPRTAVGALSKPVALGRPRASNRTTPTTNEALIGGKGRHSAGQRRRLQQEAVRSASRLRLSTERLDGHPQRLRHHLPLASVGRSGAARLVSADARRGVLGRQRLSAGHHRSRRMSRRAFRTRRSDPTSAFRRSAARTSARAEFRCPGSPRRISAGQRDAAPRLHRVVEPDLRAQAAGADGRDRLATSGRDRSVASRSSTSTPRRSRDPATRDGRCSRNSDGPRQRGSGMAARTATTIRCRRR